MPLGRSGSRNGGGGPSDWPPRGLDSELGAGSLVRRPRGEIWRDELDGRPRRHRRLGGGGRFGPRYRRLKVGFFGARPTEFSPQCVVAVGHCRSPSLSDDADVGHSQVSTKPAPAHRIRPSGCAASVQQTQVNGDSVAPATIECGLRIEWRAGDRGRGLRHRTDRERILAPGAHVPQSRLLQTLSRRCNGGSIPTMA